MIFNIIASGSKGNATLIKYKNTLILVDMGVSLSTLKEGLHLLGKDLDDLDCCVITHEHGDHIKGIKYLKSDIIRSLDKTLDCDYRVVKINKTFTIKDVDITPIRTSHDAINPCGYIFQGGKEKLVYITDTGYIPDDTLKLCANPTYLIIESNHDIKMLMKSNRTMELKRRILSDVGHLCNEDAAIYACNLIGKDTKQIYLAHISEECNKEEVALEAWKQIFKYYKIDFDKYEIRYAKQYENVLGGENEN